jgi:hypothetical protein
VVLPLTKFWKKGIILEFRYKDLYLYDYTKPDKKHVEQMKILAESGKGSTTYVNQNVRENYKKNKIARMWKFY